MITNITITNFKNYASASATFVSKLNFITGLNGSGKTNLLDAIHYICVTKSMTTGRDRYVVNFGADFFRLDAQISKQGEDFRVEAKVRPGKSKEIVVNGKTVERLADHVGFQPVIVLAPSDQVMIEGASVERRRFLDFYLSQMDASYLQALMHYNKLLQQRNAVLKDAGFRADRTLLSSYAERMAPLAMQVIAKREEFVDGLKGALKDLTSEISNSNDQISISYRSDLQGISLTDALTASLSDDLRLGRTTRGIHRDDLIFDLGDMLLRRYGSQGQRKSFLIALHLALHDYLEKKAATPPVILLDDIFDKLDDDRVLQLLNLLGREDFGQVFITDARKERLAKICGALETGARVFEIANNGIASVEDFNL